MAYYDALITKWATLTPGTTAAKLAQINAITVTGAAIPMIVPTYKIYNLIDPTEFGALSATNQQLVRDILSMGTVDGSAGTAIRARMVAIFTNASGATRVALAALAATFDSPPIPWWQGTVAQGGGGLQAPVAPSDLVQAGNLT
jgi:hypothetical protein